jgi:hypothetical protein
VPAVLPAVLLSLQVTCKYSISVVDTITGVGVPSATINGQWSSKKRVNGWPYNAAGTTPGNSGTVVVVSSKTLQNSGGNGCTFTVNSISKAGYVWDTTNSLRVSSLTW